jgi:membrane protein
MTATDARQQPNFSSEAEQAEQCGLSAAAAFAIPLQKWFDILWNIYEGILENRILLIAAGISFYLILAVFPGLAALISVYGLFVNPRTVADHLGIMAGVAPAGAVEVLRDQLTRLTQQSGTTLQLSFFASLVVSCWSAASGFKAIFDGLNVAYGETEKRSYVKLTAIALMFTVAAIGFVQLLLAAVVALPVALAFIPVPGLTGAFLDIARWPALFALVLVALSVCYRWGPSHSTPRRRWFSPGGVTAAVLWLAVSIAFSWYVANFGSYNKTYGSLGAVVGFMTWIWLSIVIVLVGAELDAEIERRAVVSNADRISWARRARKSG